MEKRKTKLIESKVFKKYQEILDLEKDKKFQIHILPQQLCDKKSAKLMEKMINLQIDKYKDVITAITSARRFVQDVFGRPTPDSIWDRIMDAVIRMNITDLKITKLK